MRQNKVCSCPTSHVKSITFQDGVTVEVGYSNIASYYDRQIESMQATRFAAKCLEKVAIFYDHKNELFWHSPSLSAEYHTKIAWKRRTITADLRDLLNETHYKRWNKIKKGT